MYKSDTPKDAPPALNDTVVKEDKIVARPESAQTTAPGSSNRPESAMTTKTEQVDDYKVRRDGWNRLS